jgi:hypothetical protein
MAEYEVKDLSYKESDGKEYEPSTRRGVFFVPRLSKIELTLESFTAMRYHGE